MEKEAEIIQNYLHGKIPLLRAMGFEFTESSSQALTLQAPFAPNINDKGTVFGGSTYSAAVLAGYGFLFLIVRRWDLNCDLMIHRATIDYERPIAGSFRCVASSATGEDRKDLQKKLEEKGKGSYTVKVEVFSENGERAALFEGRYVAVRK